MMIESNAVEISDCLHVWLWDKTQYSGVDRQHEKYRLPNEHNRITNRSAALRCHLLARIYGGTADDWCITHDHHGKPFVKSSISTKQVSISAARTGTIEVFASTQVGALGVDVESLVHSSERLNYVSDTFSKYEQQVLRSQTDRKPAIIDLWNLKEAHGKALGIGLNIPPEQNSFDLTNRSKPRLCDENNQSSEMSSWQFNVCSPCSDLRLTTAVKPEIEGQISVRVEWIEADEVLSAARRTSDSPATTNSYKPMAVTI